ncbi:MAG: hypothetical protein A2887_05800 [Alphaproteobacteria bacterium RIFCSPLOWO2_01_FULL_40_26]|nr:MAG: hypothetical protein A3D15_02060 [Alphaproteobacteria bacterium RIFCSPHIGHO2_02_FULL_40_34]OFW88090.1 MAG: hypothetical protein A2794_00320 [Alphaproteobacteria bacterium RIFCSPHIGHO2_01_FULL_40_8]OFW94241.1 MAG: hypothetical protein A2887_05800 [Alphaproteobacteria bacterium RIFCSPLOWO2_01_FULL_40_26]OFX09810.1 MAG: hypothetical protein A3H30_00560 [Alphaproteobacteria bacterium RIFCSPLOWO2_02_FULL_40_19]OFX12249.1 MAG: hypothetical protein A3G22_06870 [Alphaproteobacteria bacterium RI
MSKSESHKVTIDSVRSEAVGKQRMVNEELAALRQRLGITAPDSEIMPLDADGEPDLAAIYSRITAVENQIRELEKASSVKTPAQVKELLDNFIREQDRFMVAMKMTQAHYFSAVIANCDEISAHLQTHDNLAAIPRLSDLLKHDVQRVNEIPSIAHFEDRSDELTRLASLQAVAARMIAPIASLETPLASADAHDSLQLRQMAASLAEALQENIRPFAVFIANQSKPLSKHEPIPDDSAAFGTARDTVIGHTIALAEAQAARYQELSDAKNRELQQQKQKLAEELKKAEEKLEQEKKPKALWKRALSAITFGAYSGGKPTNTESTETQIKQLRENLAQIEQQIKSGETQLREAKGFIHDIEQYRDGIIAKHQQHDLSAFARGTGEFADQISIHREVRKVVQQQAKEETEHQTKEQILAKSIGSGFEEAFVIAEAVRSGKVEMKGDAVDAALGGVKMAAEYIPYAGTAISVLATVASQVNKVRRTEKNTNVVKFATEHETTLEAVREEDTNLRDLIVEHFTSQLGQIYGHIDADGASPLDPLTRKGIASFATHVVGSAISQISSFSLQKDVEIPALDVLRFRSDETYRTQISSDYGIEINHARLMDPEYAKHVDNCICASFVAKILVSETIAGVETGRMPKQLRELSSKTRFGAEDIEPQHAGQKFTVNGMMRRVGIITCDGQRLTSTERKEGMAGEGSKYGFRLATEAEEKAIAAGEVVAGYRKFNPVMEVFEKQKQEFLRSLGRKDFKDSTDHEKSDEAVLAFIERCVVAKAANAKLNLHEFLKKESPFKAGTTRLMFGFGADEDRERFRVIEKDFTPLLALYERAKQVEETRAARAEERTARVDHEALSSLTGAGAAPSAAKDEKRDIEKYYIPQETRIELVKYLEVETSHTSAFDRHRIEAQTGVASKFDAFLRGIAGVQQESLPGFLQRAISNISARITGTTTQSDDFASHAKELAQSFSAQEDEMSVAVARKMTEAVARFEEMKKDYAEKRSSALATVAPHDLTDPRFFTATNGANGVLTAFAESYHAKMSEGANAEEMHEFATKNIATFLKTENSELTRQVEEFAAAYSATHFAEAQVKKSIADAIKSTQMRAHRVTEREVIEAAHQAVQELRASGADFSALGIKFEDNRIMIPHTESTKEKPLHIEVELDHNGDVKDVHLHAHREHDVIRDILAGHDDTHHDIAKEIIAIHNERLAKHVESRHEGMSR